MVAAISCLSTADVSLGVGLCLARDSVYRRECLGKAGYAGSPLRREMAALAHVLLDKRNVFWVHPSTLSKHAKVGQT